MVQKTMMKIIAFCFVFLLLFSSEPLFAEDDPYYVQLTFEPEYVLDQTQENGTYKLGFYRQITLSQSFIPTVSPLTKVEVLVEKPRKTEQPLVLSIRNSLDGSTLSSATILAEDVPFYTNWLEFDITDIDVNVGETYYIELRSNTPSDYPYRWYYDYNGSDDIYANGLMYRYFSPSATWEPVETSTDYVDACFRTYSYYEHVDLECEGYLNWTDVQPAQINLTGFFVVRNNGTPYSKLNWKVQTWPSWGTWQFSMMEQTGLRPEDGNTLVSILVEAPHSNVPDEYLGKIVIINKDDANDTAEIHARLVTPKSKTRVRIDAILSSVLKLLERYEKLFQLELFKQFFM